MAWVNAEDPGAMVGGLAAVAAALGLEAGPGSWRGGRAVRHWLEMDGDRCLLVFDNANDPEALRPSCRRQGRASAHHQQRAVGGGPGADVPVGVFTLDEALAFLAERTGSAIPDGAQEAGRELGCLPLALAQAAAVIADQQLDYGTYLGGCRDMPVELLTPGRRGPVPARRWRRDPALPGAVRAGDGTGLCGGDGADIGAVARRGAPGAAAHGRAGRGAGPGRAAGRGSARRRWTGAGAAGRGVAADLQRRRLGRQRAPPGDAGDPGTAGRQGPSRRPAGGRRSCSSSGRVTARDLARTGPRPGIWSSRSWPCMSTRLPARLRLAAS